MDRNRSVSEGDVEVAKTLLSANVETDKIVTALIYRGMEISAVRQLLQDLRGSGLPTEHVTPPPAPLAPPPLPAPAEPQKAISSQSWMRRKHWWIEAIGLLVIFAFFALKHYADSQLQEIQRLSQEGWRRPSIQSRQLSQQSSLILRKGWSQAATNPDAALNTSSELQQLWSTAAKAATGQRKLIMQAGAAMIRKMIEVSQQLSASGQLIDKSVDLRDVTELQQLEAKMQLLQQASENLEDVRSFYAHFPDFYRAELSRYKVDTGLTETLVTSFSNSLPTAMTMTLISAIGDCVSDSQQLQSFLKTNWGGWAVNGEFVTFNDPVLKDTFALQRTKLENSMLIASQQAQQLKRVRPFEPSQPNPAANISPK
jgi:hypothetical protein